LAHDIVANEGCLYAAHFKVQRIEYRIVHVFLTFGASISPGMPTDTDRYGNSRFALLKINYGIWHKGPMYACRSPNSS
jgi:hypothetical protein